VKRVRDRGESVRRFILDNVEDHPRDVAKLTAERFGISRQAVNKHLAHLVREGALDQSGATASTIYVLAPTLKWVESFPISPHLEEDRVLREHVLPRLSVLPDNVRRIWEYGFTEILNNAIDHSEGSSISVSLTRYPASTELWIADDGIGIFKKIQEALGLPDVRQSVLELSKGKFTTDPSRHSGEGIFFASRAFDHFAIVSDDTHFAHEAGKAEDWILEGERTPESGTHVFMQLSNHTSRTLKAIFDEFSTDDNYGFNKTIVPVKLARYGTENLLSRSQAKRLLTRVDRFQTVLFDFTDVESIGQAFADEIFRVFASQHPGMELYPVHANAEVRQMISRVVVPARQGSL
jgi:anti-sigma regulatory factor (Ser/Thr protein kinase)